MSSKNCVNCKYHDDYWDEDEETIYDDGCVCNHEKGNEEYHCDICYKYSENQKELGCKYYKERL